MKGATLDVMLPPEIGELIQAFGVAAAEGAVDAIAERMGLPFNTAWTHEIDAAEDALKLAILNAINPELPTIDIKGEVTDDYTF